MTVHNFGVFNLKFYIKITTLIKQPTLIKLKHEDIHAFPTSPQVLFPICWFSLLAFQPNLIKPT